MIHLQKKFFFSYFIIKFKLPRKIFSVILSIWIKFIFKKKASEEDNLKSQLNELPNKEAELSSNEIEYKKFIYSKFSRLLRKSG